MRLSRTKRVGVLGCSKRKLSSACMAKDMYRGRMFVAAVPWIEKRADEWCVLSAKHGVLLPNDRIEPYDMPMPTNEKERSAWRAMVDGQLLARWGRGVIYMVVAGAHYRLALRSMPMVESPFECWASWRRNRGMSGSRSVMGYALLCKALEQDMDYY